MDTNTKTYSFTDLVDSEIVLRVMNGFYKVTDIPPSITDINGKVLLTIGFKSICENFHRVHPETRKKCVQSDTTLSQELAEKAGYACYECLNGLVDVAIPIIIDGNHLANLFIGQFFLDNPPDGEFFRKQGEKYGFNMSNYMAALDEVPVFPRKRIEDAIHFLANLAELLGEMALTQKRLTAFNERLEDKVRQRTDQLKCESEERKNALAEFETIFNNSSVAIAHIKGDRIVHNVNDRFVKLSGYTREELIGQQTSLGYRSEDEARAFGEQAFPRLCKGEVVQTESQFMCKDGSLLWCSMSGRAVNPPHLEDGVIWTLDDITQRKEFEKLKDDVDRIMRHDLKVPLNGILGMTQALLLDADLNDRQREDVKMIEESGYRMNNQINQSLELYKIETGTYQYVPLEVDMGVSLRKVVSDLSRKASENLLRFNITVKGVPQEESPSFLTKADPMLTHTMLSNLIDNAVEAAPPRSVIDISIDEAEDHVSLTIVNQGTVPYEIRDNFFDKYVTHGKGGGTGLGTYTAMLMAQAQGGDIAMETDEETGTAITVRLPLWN